MNLFSGNDLDPTDQPDAALIFGGDGTLHRHIGGLALKQIPGLIVPMGSANDFAHSIGIETVGKAQKRFHAASAFPTVSIPMECAKSLALPMGTMSPGICFSASPPM